MDRKTLPSICTMDVGRISPFRLPQCQPPQEKIILLRKYTCSPNKRNTMSVTEPADSGSSQTASQILQVEKFEDISALGSWAQMMEEEVFDPLCDEDEEGTDEVDCGDNSSSMSPERRRHIPDEPPFRVQITNIDRNHCQEDLLYFFGGEKLVKHCDFQMDDGKAEFEFHALEGLLSALKKAEVQFKGRLLKVYVLRNHHSQSPAKVANRHSQDYRHYESQDSQHRRQDVRSHYNSQSSLNSDRHFRNDRSFSNRNNYQNQQYGTMPAGGFHGNREYSGQRGGYHGGYNNNNHDNSRNSFRAPRCFQNPQFDRQNSQPQYNNYNRSYDNQGGPLQRSGSYQSGGYRNDYQQNYRHQPGSVSARSRTESHSTNNLDGFSRASSRLSVATDEPAKVIRKPSANPFGDAKPVDTQAKLLEAEKRQSEKESQKTEKSEAIGDHSVEDVNSPVVNQNSHHQNQQMTGNPHKYNQYYNNYAGYSTRGNFHQGQYQQPRRHHYDGAHYEHPQHQQQHQPQQQQQSFDQNAPPGSFVIKKRESADTESHKEDEVPPLDPVHYPLENDKKLSTASDSTHSDLNKSDHHQHLPPHPSNSQSSRGNRPHRPTMKPYTAARGGHHLQKSATVGEMCKGDGDGDVQQKSHQHGKRYQQQNQNNYQGARRPSLSGSESGRGGGEPKSRGSKRGGRGGRGGASGQRGGRRGDGEGRKADESSIQEVEVPKENKPKEQKPEVVKEEKKPETSTEAKKEPVVEVKEPTTSSEANLTPKKKKESKKKKEKKEAKTPQLGPNKFAALVDAPQ